MKPAYFIIWFSFNFKFRFSKMMFQGPKGYIAQICEVHLQYDNSTAKWPFYTFSNSTLIYILFSLVSFCPFFIQPFIFILLLVFLGVMVFVCLFVCLFVSNDKRQNGWTDQLQCNLHNTSEGLWTFNFARKKMSTIVIF